MSMRNIILHEAKPILQECGYMFRTSSPGSYCFCKCDAESSKVICFYGPRTFTRSIDVSYMVRQGQHYVLSFEFSDFPNGKRFIYSPNSALAIEDYLRDVLIVTKKEVLQYIERITQFHVSANQCLYQNLAQSFQQYAEELLAQGKNHLGKSRESFMRLDDELKCIRPPELESLQAGFSHNKSQVLRIAAVLGELILMNNGQKFRWGWYNPKTSDNLKACSHAPENQIYGLVSISGDILYVDPLAAVLDVWNHAELKGHTLHRFAYF